MSIQENINQIQSQISHYKNSTLIAVTKKRSIKEVNEVIQAGISNIAENRLEEAEKKLSQIPQNITKHFIGNIQSKKIKEIVHWFDIIHSVDRFKVAQKINQEADRQGKNIKILIQVNTSNELQKGGIRPEKAEEFIRQCQDLNCIEIIGLMTMAMQSDDNKKIRSCFQQLIKLRDHLQENYPSIQELSMGMSNDYQIALEEGATMIRLGRILFEN